LTQVLLAGTCENQDYFLPQRLELSDAAVFESQAVDILQPYRGLNSLDFTVLNTGTEPAQFALAVSVCNQTDTGDCSRPDGTRLLADEGPMEPGDRFSDRLNEAELGLGDQMHVEFMCYSDSDDDDALCSGTLTYVVLLRQVECRVDTECAGDETCDTELGLCRRETQSDEGCRQVTSASRSVPFWYCIMLGLMLIRCRRRAC